MDFAIYRDFFAGSYREKTTSSNLETIIAKNLIPIRPNRHQERNLKVKTFHGFLYRVA
ncbi:hypothetical protein CNEO3_1250003 [Clostridium neonatale]|nr:hypothetical protein CNEO3_1250003 [Clostridium neonatale]